MINKNKIKLLVEIETNKKINAYYYEGDRIVSIPKLRKIFDKIESKYPDKEILVDLQSFHENCELSENNCVPSKNHFYCYYKRFETDEEYNNRIKEESYREKIAFN